MEIQYRSLVVVVERLYSLPAQPYTPFADTLPEHRKVKTFPRETVAELISIVGIVIAENKTVVVFFDHTVPFPSGTGFIDITDISGFRRNTVQMGTFRYLCLILEKAVPTICIIRIDRITFFNNGIDIIAIDPFHPFRIYNLIVAIGNITGNRMLYTTGLKPIACSNLPTVVFHFTGILYRRTATVYSRHRQCDQNVTRHIMEKVSRYIQCIVQQSQIHTGISHTGRLPFHIRIGRTVSGRIDNIISEIISGSNTDRRQILVIINTVISDQSPGTAQFQGRDIIPDAFKELFFRNSPSQRERGEKGRTVPFGKLRRHIVS